jgi:hypothetical protein
MLHWEGSGLPRQLLSASALRTLDGEERGLLAEYRSTSDPDSPPHVRTDTSLAVVWPNGPSQAPTDLDVAVRDRLWTELTDPSDTDKRSLPSEALLKPAADIVGVLSPQRQAAWIDYLQEHPRQLSSLTMREVKAIYGALRFASPDEALGVLGSWLQQNAALRSEFSFRFSRINRDPYFELADMVTRQYEPHGKLLEDRYLVTPSGGCSLPAAYTMAFVHIARGDWSKWADFVDAKIDDEGIPTAARVDWLIARSMAEEVKLNSNNPYERPTVFPLRGKRYLIEAWAIADSAEIRERVYHELIARYASALDFPEAERLIGEAGDVSATTLTHWRSETERLRQALLLDKELQVAQRQASRRRIYEKYLEKARTHSDAAAVQHYEQLLEGLE